jgi:hypothetical protein
MVVQNRERVRPQGPRTFGERLQQLARASTLSAEILNTISRMETERVEAMAQRMAEVVVAPRTPESEEADSCSGTDDGAVEDFEGNNASS